LNWLICMQVGSWSCTWWYQHFVGVDSFDNMSFCLLHWHLSF
jgi:hypothetical protein